MYEYIIYSYICICRWRDDVIRDGRESNENGEGEGLKFCRNPEYVCEFAILGILPRSNKFRFIYGTILRAAFQKKNNNNNFF